MTEKFIQDPWAKMTTRNGLAGDEVISALQKSIRRGKEKTLANLLTRCILLHHSLKKSFGDVCWQSVLRISVWEIL